MKIGIIALSLNKNSTPGYYNSQELGLGKALASCNHFVKVYKLFSSNTLSLSKTEVVNNNLLYIQLPAHALGINGFFNKKLLDSSLDALICFCDIQLYTLSIATWCKKHNIAFYPYIGVITSSSINLIYKHLMNIFARYLIRFYRNQKVILVKTPSVLHQLLDLGISTAKLAPIGLDTTLLINNYEQFNTIDLKTKWGYSSSDKIILFIGRLVPEKEPLEMIKIFAEAYQIDSNLRLCMIGHGELQAEVEMLCRNLDITHAVKIFSSIPNKHIWEFYRISNYLINLNHHEIYGMVLMEAMYYECPIIAYHAPGPDFIIGDLANDSSIPVYLVNHRAEIVSLLTSTSVSCKLCTLSLHEKITQNFTWEKLIEHLPL